MLIVARHENQREKNNKCDQAGARRFYRSDKLLPYGSLLVIQTLTSDSSIDLCYGIFAESRRITVYNKVPHKQKVHTRSHLRWQIPLEGFKR